MRIFLQRQIYELPVVDPNLDIDKVESKARESMGYQLDKTKAAELGGPSSGLTECVLTTHAYKQYLLEAIKPGSSITTNASNGPLNFFDYYDGNPLKFPQI